VGVMARNGRSQDILGAQIARKYKARHRTLRHAPIQTVRRLASVFQPDNRAKDAMYAAKWHSLQNHGLTGKSKDQCRLTSSPHLAASTERSMLPYRLKGQCSWAISRESADGDGP